MDVEIAMALGNMSEKINDMGYRIDQMMQMLNAQRKEEIEAITPYTETQTAYIGDTEKTFYTDIKGNLTVYFPYEYSVERLSDRIFITFDPLEEVTDITISIL